MEKYGNLLLRMKHLKLKVQLNNVLPLNIN